MSNDIKEINLVQANDKTYIVREIAESGIQSLTTAQDFDGLVNRLKVVFEATPAIAAPTPVNAEGQATVQ